MLILASTSPRRAELLTAAGIEFAVRAADVDETLLPGESPADYVLRLSRSKALAVARPGDLVLGADTTVVIHDEIAAKPIDHADAKRMLRALSGQWHDVLTGVTLLRDDMILSDVDTTRVRFVEISDSELDWYVSTGEPMDKAGAYGIQGLASRFVERIEGNYANVVGLPVEMVYRMMKSVKSTKYKV
ncbi:MAG: septum formation inhibitor Maf [Acidobacteria bacterium]|nr:septum formation inhibitor Maf [Acidobacteriota bacterium]